MHTAQVGKRIKLSNVLFLTDFSIASERALPFVCDIAREYGASVSALHVLVPDVLTYMAGKFVTLFYGVLDADEKSLRYTSAGHPKPVLRSASGSVRQLENGGAVFGVFPNWKYEDSVAKLAPGDRLVLFTDGITEMAKPDAAQLGDDGLIHLVGMLTDESASGLTAKLLVSVKSFCDARLQDDATLITIVAGTARS